MSAPRLTPGMVVDDFVVGERLHTGGMASLWSVTRADAPGDAAGSLIMKVPRLRDHDDPTAIVGFEVEQMIMPALAGPHVPRFVASGDFDAQPYIVMERVGGESLRPRLAEAPLPPQQVASIGARIAVALHALHRQQVIHLDIKPSNVMFREDGTAVLIDFGLARHDALPDLLAEEFRLPLGTAPYMSPEQVLRVRNEPRSDLFALGVVMYHLLTGRRPFGWATSVRGLKRRLWRDALPPRAIAPDVPPWLQELVLRCLEVEPGARHETAAQLAFDLQHSEQVELTARAHRLRADGPRKVMKRWFRAIGAEAPAQQSTQRQLARAPIVAVAVGLAPDTGPLAGALRATVRRILQIEPGARLACLSVLRVNRIGMDTTVDAQGNNLHVKRLVALKHWARALELPAERVTFHVLEAPDAATAIVDYVRQNQVDHVVIGARGSSALRRYLGSVSSQVVAEAPCSVTVVRASQAASRDVETNA